jgi:putative PIG3 family NAD(P)H quinone oxidoreductase
MKAVWVREYGSAENLEVREIADLPQPAADRALIHVKAAALNRADLLQRRGLYPAPKGFPSEILGLEFAGEVAAVGDAVQNLKIGQRVFGITAGAAQAEFVLSPENTLIEIPSNLSFTEAAAVPEAFITAHDALFTQADLRMSEIVLIHAIGSGVGLAALQLAKAAGAFAVGTSRTPDKIERAVRFGLDVGILSKNELSAERFAEIVRNETGGAGANVVLDLVGAKYLQANLLSLTKLGRSRAEIDILTVMSKRLRLFGTVLRSRSAEEKAAATRLFADQVVPLLARGIVKPAVDRVFPLAEIRAAHEYLESNQSFGKVVLEI